MAFSFGAELNRRVGGVAKTACLGIGHSLDLFVIAQQLEKAEQLGPLKLAGVDAAQGYYFGQPS